MKVTLEQIDELRSRVNVSYEEAKATLEKNDGDLIKSIIELEKSKGKNVGHKGNLTGATNKLLSLKMSIKNKEGSLILDVPLVMVLFAFIMAFWSVIIFLAIAIFTSCKIRIYRSKGSLNVEGIKKNVKSTVDKIKVKSGKIIEDDQINIDMEDDDSEENEIIIE